VSSYVENTYFFANYPRLSAITDGLSNTIWFTERYAWNCNGTISYYFLGHANPWRPAQPATFAHSTEHGRPTPGDLVPITVGDPPVSRAEGNRTFQLKPRVADCDPRLPNSSTTRGLQIALADGSVRIVGAGIAPELFWGMVTHNGGEVLQD
jgi:Protein of unknown function (DUF1559)